MQNFKVLDEKITVPLPALDSCQRTFWDLLSGSIETIDVSGAIANRSTSLKKSIYEHTKNIKGFTWYTKTRDGQGPFQLDASYSCNSNCGKNHKINIVSCLNNREAIGSNFLKLEVQAMSDFSIDDSSPHLFEDSLGILITFDRGLLEQGGWDPAYAEATEYSFAYKKYFGPILKSNII